MKRWLGYGLLGLLAYAVFTLIQLPAAALIDFIAQRVSGFSVQNLRGLALQGSAQGVRVRGVPFESLAWQLRFMPLVLGRLAYRFSLIGLESRLEGVIATGLNRQLYVDELSGSLPFPSLMALLGRPVMPLAGQVELAATRLQVAPEGRLAAASGTARLLRARTTVGQPLEFGDFSAEWSTKDQDIVGSIKDDGGPLEFNGILTLTPNGGYRFSGHAAVREQSNRELQQAIGLLGRPGGDGKWKFNFNGTL